jgi:acetoacetyl-CoA synthetase
MTSIVSSRVEIRRATSEDIERICRFLEPAFAGTSVAFWRGVLAYSWLPPSEKTDYGEVLIADGKVAGFFGAMYSDRQVRGRRERFCNVFAWYVHPEHRRHSIALVASLVRRPGVTFVNVTPADHVVPIFRRLGFTLTDTERVICRPFSRRLLTRGGGRVSVLPHDRVTRDALEPAEFAIFQDHYGRTVRRTVFEAGGERCLIVSKRMYWSGVRYPRTDLYYVSNREFFERHFEQAVLRLLWSDKTVALHADPSLLGFVPRGSTRIAATALYPSATLFKSATVGAGDVDRLYSELVILP